MRHLWNELVVSKPQVSEIILAQLIVSSLSLLHNGNNFLNDTCIIITHIDHSKNIDYNKNPRVIMIICSFLKIYLLIKGSVVSNYLDPKSTEHVPQRTVHLILNKIPNELVRGIREKSNIVANVSSQGLNPLSTNPLVRTHSLFNL